MAVDKTFEHLIFGIITDIHCTNNKGDRTNQYTARALRTLREKAGRPLDCLAIPGDLTQNGQQDQVETCARIFHECLSLSETPVIYCSGNHDHFTEPDFETRIATALGEENFSCDLPTGEPHGSRHVVKNGVHFLCVNAINYVVPNQPYAPETVAWLEQELKIAAESAPEMPIFVLSHLAVSNTVYGSDFYTAEYPNLTWHSQQLRELLSRYPQVIYLCGHLHFPFNGDTSIMQDGFTAVNCACISYLVVDFGFWQCDEGLGAIPPEAAEHPQGMLAEVDVSGAVRLTRYDFGTGMQVGEPWVIPAPSAPGHLSMYSPARRNLHFPVFPVPDAKAITVPTGENRAKLALRFSAAETASQIYYYEVELFRAHKAIFRRRYLTDFYLTGGASSGQRQWELELGEVETDAPLRVTVTPVDIWGNAGVTQSVLVE